MKGLSKERCISLATLLALFVLLAMATGMPEANSPMQIQIHEPLIGSNFAAPAISVGPAISVISVGPASSMAPVAAWGNSTNIAVLPASCGPRSSCQMGGWCENKYAKPGRIFTDVSFASVNATMLAGYDTVFMFASNPNQLSATQKADLVAWVFDGGKLIIWPGEDPYLASPAWDYSWLPYPIALSIPGYMGAQGTLTIDEISTLTQGINITHLDATDAVGDADVMTIQSSGWCAAMTANNSLGVTGPVEMYAKYGDGIIMFNGLDWDYADCPGWEDAVLTQVMANMFDVDSLPCGKPWNGNLEVNKTTNATQCLGKTIEFEVTVTNNQPLEATNVQWNDTPPAEITLYTTSGSIGTLAANGGTATFTINASADAIGTGLKNEVLITGDGPSGVPFSGTDTATFDIVECENEIPVKLDINPGCCPNLLYMKCKGVLPVAILGTDEFDVQTIDPSTIKLGLADTIETDYVSPIIWAIEDVATPFDGEGCYCHELEADGQMDLTLKFDTQELVALIEKAKIADTFPLTIVGNLMEEEVSTRIMGRDCILLSYCEMAPTDEEMTATDEEEYEEGGSYY